MTAADDSAARASLPSDPEAARLYAEGLTKLRSFDAQGARESLQKALEIEPDVALAHAALSDAWHASAYEEQSRQEIKKAFDNSKGLSREERLSIEGRYRQAFLQGKQAVEIYRTLFGFFPDNVDYGLNLARALEYQGRASEAFVIVAQLRQLPPPARDDPRIDFEEGYAATWVSNFDQSATAYGRAAQKANQIGARALTALAWDGQANAFTNLGKFDQAHQALEEGRKAALAVGNENAVANSLSTLGKLQLREEDLTGAESSFQQVLAIRRKIGDQHFAALMLTQLGTILEAEGKLSEAKDCFEEAVRISRDLNDVAAQARILSFVGNLMEVQGSLPQARQKYAEAQTLWTQAGLHVEEERNELSQAEISILEGQPQVAEAVARKVAQDPESARRPMLKNQAANILARALVAEGKVTEARQAMAEGATAAGKAGDFLQRHSMAILAERLRAGSGNPSDVAEARKNLQAVVSDATSHGMVEEEFESKLALGEIETNWGDKTAGRALLAALARDAHSKGFGLIAHRAEAMQSAGAKGFTHTIGQRTGGPRKTSDVLRPPSLRKGQPGGYSTGA